jgi:pimeloyl-ACP methyl ester carboxylesterase
LHHGYRVIAHDRRGHGRSLQVSDGNDMDHYADDLAGLTQHLDLRDAVHVGHSAGGGEAVQGFRKDLDADLGRWIEIRRSTSPRTPHPMIRGFQLVFHNDLTIAEGLASARAYIEGLLPDVLEGRVEPGRVLDRTVGLACLSGRNCAMPARGDQSDGAPVSVGDPLQQRL